jgi:predicted lipoprotein
MIVLRRLLTAYLIVSICFLTTSCVFVPIDPDAKSGKGNVISSGEKAVDLEAYLNDYLEPAIIPEINERRTDLSSLLDSAANGWDAAGEAFGVRKGEIGAKYNFIVHDTVTVLEVNTESKAGFILVKCDNLQTNFTIKITTGPVLRGTAIRDSLKCVDFNQFVNQMDYAGLANELNKYGNQNVLKNIDIAALAGKTIDFTGSFTQPEADEISIMPIFMEII